MKNPIPHPSKGLKRSSTGHGGKLAKMKHQGPVSPKTKVHADRKGVMPRASRSPKRG